MTDWQFENFHVGAINGEPCVVVEAIEPVVNQVTAEVHRYEISEVLCRWDGRGGLVRDSQASDRDRNAARNKLLAMVSGLSVKWQSTPA